MQIYLPIRSGKMRNFLLSFGKQGNSLHRCRMEFPDSTVLFRNLCLLVSAEQFCTRMHFCFAERLSRKNKRISARTFYPSAGEKGKVPSMQSRPFSFYCGKSRVHSCLPYTGIRNKGKELRVKAVRLHRIRKKRKARKFTDGLYC